MAAAVIRSTTSALLALLCAACISINADQRTFDGTRWHVVAVNGRPTPSAGEYQIAFGQGRMSGRFGCNGFGGPYSIRGDTLVATDMASTLMGCPEPSATFESAGFAILRQPMRSSWTNGDRLTLANAAGKIELQRAP